MRKPGLHGGATAREPPRRAACRRRGSARVTHCPKAAQALTAAASSSTKPQPSSATAHGIAVVAFLQRHRRRTRPRRACARSRALPGRCGRGSAPLGPQAATGNRSSNRYVAVRVLRSPSSSISRATDRPSCSTPAGAARGPDASTARSPAVSPARPRRATASWSGSSIVRRRICRRIPSAAVITWIESSWMSSAMRARSSSPAATNSASSSNRCASAGATGDGVGWTGRGWRREGAILHGRATLPCGRLRVRPGAAHSVAPLRGERAITHNVTPL